MKDQHPTDDAIVDDMAGQAYVEQFGLETFSRADNAVLGGKATKCATSYPFSPHPSLLVPHPLLFVPPSPTAHAGHRNSFT